MSRLNTLIIILTLFSLNTLLSQQVTWEKNYGGSGWDYTLDMQQTQDGGYILTGYSASDDQDVTGNYGDYDCWVVKVDKNGTIEWEQNFGGSALDDANSVIQTNDNGYVIAGSSMSNDNDVSDNNGGRDYWIFKLNQAGELIWEQNYGGSGDDTAYEIIQTIDGGYIAVGETQSDDQDVTANNGLGDFWVVKLNSNGVLQWEENYGGTDRDNAQAVLQTQDGGYITAGWARSADGDVSGNYGEEDCWVVKLDTVGTIEWEQNYGGSMDDILFDVEITSEGDYVLGGYSASNDQDISSNFGSYDYWLVRIKKKGVMDWERNYGSSDMDIGQSLVKTRDGGYLMGGYINGSDFSVSDWNGSDDFWMIKVDEEGLYEWEHNLGGTESDKLTALLQTRDGGFVAAGGSNSDNYDVAANYGEADYWMTRICFKSSSSISRTVCNSYTLPSGRATYNTTGTYKDTIPNEAGCDSVITINLTVNKVDSSVIQSGNILQANMFNANYQWGRCEDTFRPIAGATEQTFVADSSGEYAVVVMNNGCKDTSECQSVTVKTTDIDQMTKLSSKTRIYPNPAGEQVTVDLPINHSVNRVNVVEISGKTVYSTEVRASKSTVNIPLKGVNGVYFIAIEKQNKTETYKIIKGK